MKIEVTITHWYVVKTPLSIGGVNYNTTQIASESLEVYTREVSGANYSEIEEVEREARLKAESWKKKLGKERIGEFPFVFPQTRNI